MTEVTKVVDAGIDCPDVKDWNYTDIIKDKKVKIDSDEEDDDEEWWDITSPLQFIKDNLIIRDQWADKLTKNACWFYWLFHIYNAERLILPVEQRNPAPDWIAYQAERPENEKWGGT